MQSLVLLDAELLQLMSCTRQHLLLSTAMGKVVSITRYVILRDDQPSLINLCSFNIPIPNLTGTNLAISNFLLAVGTKCIQTE